MFTKLSLRDNIFFIANNTIYFFCFNNIYIKTKLNINALTYLERWACYQLCHVGRNAFWPRIINVNKSAVYRKGSGEAQWIFLL